MSYQRKKFYLKHSHKVAEIEGTILEEMQHPLKETTPIRRKKTLKESSKGSNSIVCITKNGLTRKMKKKTKEKMRKTKMIKIKNNFLKIATYL